MDTDAYVESICDEHGLRQLVLPLPLPLILTLTRSPTLKGSPGRSGAVFYFSHDMKYLIKSVQKKESKFLRRMMPYYYEHLMNPLKGTNTLICLFYGLMTVAPDNMATIGVVVMPNMLDTVVHEVHDPDPNPDPDPSPLEVYDLKGSTYGRITKEKDKVNPNPSP